MTEWTAHWEFPLPRVHTGMLQGNGVLGTMIWGEGPALNVTLGRADFWDRRGGMQWTPEQSYANIRHCLERTDYDGLKRLFQRNETEGEPAKPSIVPVGRIEIDLGEGAVLQDGSLDMTTGSVSVTFRRGDRRHTIRLALDMARPLLALRFDPDAAPAAIRGVPAWRAVGEHLASIGFDPPEPFESGTTAGWIQTRPADEPLCVAWRRAGGEMFVTAVIDADADASRDTASNALEEAAGQKYESVLERATAWWADYWSTVPAIEVPDDDLTFLYRYGMYKFAGLTHPGGVAATLQGPWIEDYQMPPWSSDYHFNINVQMCYWPAYHGNRLENLMPLFDLIHSWLPKLRRNAEMFIGIDDGLMLPHAVDDRGTCMGGFWTGTIDHGCTAWVASMMFRYYRYTMDEQFLRERAWPFMHGAMRVYEEMLERRPDGAFELPVSVSPEYRGSRPDAWGRNASFQLACIHMLCEMLQEAADVLGETPRPVWSEIREKLPKACLIDDAAGEPMIALWEGLPLEESHRHHSHLGGIVPFDIFDWDDPRWDDVIRRSIRHWIKKGPGGWSGWCVPWAAMIHLRLGNAESARLWLHNWRTVFTNEGHGTLHDAGVPGLSLMGIGADATERGRDSEVMQMDAGMSCTSAIQETMLHERRGVNYVFRGALRAWKDASFEGMRTGGGFLVSGKMQDGRVREIMIESPHGGTLRLANPWEGEAAVRRATGEPETLRGEVLEIATAPGERVLVTG